MKMLDKIKLTDKDILYILGDIVDRGPEGMKIIIDLIQRKNVITLRGNHDHEAMIFLKYLIMPNDGYVVDEIAEVFQLWMLDGGNTTYHSFMELSDTDKRAVIGYLRGLPIFKKIIVGTQYYFLSHTVPEKDKMLDFNNCNMYDFLMGEPDYKEKYYDDMIIVTGHTPTGFIDEASLGKLWKGNNHIAVDCGAVFDHPLGCICLDTQEEYYVE
jgi:serine/threonine protein phosphatase 1